jgi:two-component system chemotaxis sensor kinase CheA
MVRNAADHGIESTAARVSAGKPETGAITVSMLETSDDLQLTLSDDGAGLDYDGLQRKAVALGLIAENARLTQNDVVELLFQSGVSTAKVVTDVSGRGVGMDVVKRAIVEAGGKIEVTSDKGTGSKFIVSVPRNASTQILDGYMVRSFQDGIYVLPLNVVVEAFAILPHEITGIAGKGKVLNRRGKVVALHDLDALLGQRVNIFENGPEVQMMGVIVTIKGKSTALAVREIVGIQKVVCKQLEGVEIDKEIFDGAAISGTGHVSMIVNVERLLAFQ